MSDQPVYALSKEIQLRYPLVFGTEQYFCMMGDLHLEIELLKIHGELIKGSGLRGVNHSKKSRTLFQKIHKKSQKSLKKSQKSQKISKISKKSQKSQK